MQANLDSNEDSWKFYLSESSIEKNKQKEQQNQ